MAGINEAGSSVLKQYLIGFALAGLLTTLPFALVTMSSFSNSALLTMIGVSAGLQLLVHLRFFLHMDFEPHNQWFLITIGFTAVILLIMVAGTFWIVFDLYRHTVF